MIPRISRKKDMTAEQWKVLHKDMSAEAIKLSFKVNREYALSKDQYSATKNDNFWALAIAIRDRVIERWIETQQRYHKQNVKRVYYLSMEFLIGRLMGNYVYNLGIEGPVRKAVEQLGFDLEELRDQEQDAGLGNGGLGRLAACFLDSMATLGIPSHGYGIRFDYGIFNQKIKDGYQVERPDEWLRLGSPWEFARLEYAVKIRFYGRTEMAHDKTGRLCMKWVDTQDVMAVPYDYPIPGYKNNVVNTLRLWSARSSEEFDFDYFKHGDYEQAVHQKISSEIISKVLYPIDNITRGKELRLKQEYFLTAASIADIIRRFLTENSDLRLIPEKMTIQLNDTHPCLAIVELMRVLIDEYEFDWDAAWNITQRTFAYTNHTLMPEGLESWPLDLFRKLLPRHLQIIYEINARFLNDVSARYPGDVDKLARMSIIEEGAVQKVRMAHVGIVGSFSVNGVSELHSELLRKKLLPDFNDYCPEKFNNKTNGITPRRWLLKANTQLSDLITKTISDKWVTNLDQLEKLAKFKDDKAFQQKWQAIKQSNKEALARHIARTMHIQVDPHSMFDVQVKRVHEYKRQLLFALYIISEYLRLKNDPGAFVQPRTFLIGGKAAPGYFMAKLIIKFFNSIMDAVSRDRAVHGKMQVVFLENYRVSLAEKIFPASDLSEQISTAGTEASGTGNMKFMVNGALTIGTYDGANIEMAERVGKDNIFIFGLLAHEVEKIKTRGYNPQEYIRRSPMLREIMQLISNNFFSHYSLGLFDPIVDSLSHHDPFLVCADFDAYCRMQDTVSHEYQNQEKWTKKSIINVSKAGFFSSDRTIREYSRDIWKIPC
ncbi:MAG: glycogen/starch/alpha-glucan phosphorylase [Candidatus Omnitrophota bacterium]|nr:glycogen/starch/alpha-glucan phosphorylase [Candidatus Omnitrophota bacterium]MDZ4242121.1 glycogen/starch/alpha-glucan phosphorylase [Candidatus Omnitrophota bacterium]